MYLEKKRRFFPYKSHPMLVRQEKIPSSVLRPSLLSTAVYVVQYLIFTGIYLVGMLWGDIQGGPSQRWIRDALRNKNTFTIFGWSSIITFSLSHGGKKKSFLKLHTFQPELSYIWINLFLIIGQCH